MGKSKYLNEVKQLFEKSPVINITSVLRLIKAKKNVKQYYKQLLRNLVLQGKIKRLVRGFYTKQDNASFAVFCFKPAYFGLQDALSFHNLWEQETIPVIITALKTKQGIRKVIDANILIRRMNRKYFFGFDYYRQGEFYFPYSDIEKTLIDLVYFRENLSKETIKNFKKKINKKKLVSYLKHYPEKFRKRVFNSVFL